MRYSIRDIPSRSFAGHSDSLILERPSADNTLFCLFLLIFFSRRVARLHNRVADTGEFLTAAHAHQPRAPISRASGFLSLSSSDCPRSPSMREPFCANSPLQHYIQASSSISSFLRGISLRYNFTFMAVRHNFLQAF